MNEKAQAALEYLIILAGAMLVAAIVTWLLFNTASPTQNKIENTQERFFDSLNV